MREMTDIFEVGMLEDLLNMKQGPMLDLLEPAVKEWRDRMEAWRRKGSREDNRVRDGIYILRLRIRQQIATLEWMHDKYGWVKGYRGPGEKRWRNRQSLARGDRYCLRRSDFRYASDAQWEVIKEIELEAGRFRKAMAMFMEMKRHIKKIKTELGKNPTTDVRGRAAKEEDEGDETI